MPRPGARLSSVSWAGETFKLILSDKNVRALSDKIKREISQKQKMELEDICNRYFHGRRTEVASMLKSALRKRLESFRKRLESFNEATMKFHWDGYDDAGIELVSMVEENLADEILCLDNENIREFVEKKDVGFL